VSFLIDRPKMFELPPSARCTSVDLLAVAALAVYQGEILDLFFLY
jgi:hypothetical protein